MPRGEFLFPELFQEILHAFLVHLLLLLPIVGGAVHLPFAQLPILGLPIFRVLLFSFERLQLLVLLQLSLILRYLTSFIRLVSFPGLVLTVPAGPGDVVGGILDEIEFLYAHAVANHAMEPPRTAFALNPAVVFKFIVLTIIGI